MNVVKKISVYAHRGSRGTHPENTMSAFIEAERVGADGIEFDVHLTKDGELVIIHDETLNRTTTLTGFVKDYTAAELRKADAGVKFSPAFSGERIPFLSEVFEWASANKLIMNVELKNDKLHYPAMEQKVISLIRHYHLESRIVLSSFNHSSIAEVKRLAPDIERALLFEGLPDDILNILSKKKEAGFHPDAPSLTKELNKQAQDLGYVVRPWVANSKEQILRIAEFGVDVIITDFPETAIDILKTRDLEPM